VLSPPTPCRSSAHYPATVAPAGRYGVLLGSRSPAENRAHVQAGQDRGHDPDDALAAFVHTRIVFAVCSLTILAGNHLHSSSAQFAGRIDTLFEPVYAQHPGATAMNPNSRSHAAPIRVDSPFQISVIVCFAATFSYLAARLAGHLVIRPEMIWPLWPGCAFIVAILLLTPRKIWPAILAAGLAGFALYDIQERLPIRATVFLLFADSIEILVAALGVSHVFGGVPRLNSVKALAKYSLFAVILAPISVASAAAFALESDSWWVGFFTEALALLTVTPAILGWVEIGLGRVRKPKAGYLEALLMCSALATVAYFAFVAADTESRPALLYALVPLLLWAAFRFGITGTSTSIVVIGFLAIWGVVHGKGPFIGDAPQRNVLSLQLFLLVAGASFMVVAALVEERGAAEQVLHDTNRDLEAQTAELQSREELLKIFVKGVPAGVAMLDRDMRYLQVSDRWCADYGVDASQVLGRSHYELLPDMPQWWKEVHRRALAGETLREEEERWDRESGTTWVRWEVLPWTTASGMVGGILIFAENITQRKLMEEEVVDVSRKLIQSQEQERARIGRELHDDINQRLALLAVELDQLKDDPSQIEDRVRALQQQASEISNDVQALSHELHSSKLDYLGVVTGIRSWCKEFGERQGMEIDFRADVSSTVPSEIGVTLFRILQEALHNAVKHSGVKRIEVQLGEELEEIHLDIRDAGRGFDIGEARQGRGVGLVSMDERVRLVRGTVTIDSQLARGTKIHVRIPLKSDRSYRRASS